GAAKDFFEKAEAFAKSSATSHLLISIRYFEVADRFPGTATAVEAQRRSLEAMQKIIVEKPSTTRPAIPLGMAEAAYKRALTAAAAEFEKARKLAADKLAVSMTAAQAEATKKGDLDGALKLRQSIARLQSPKPKSTEELKEWLDNTVWGIRNGKLSNPVAY